MFSMKKKKNYNRIQRSFENRKIGTLNTLYTKNTERLTAPYESSSRSKIYVLINHRIIERSQYSITARVTRFNRFVFRSETHRMRRYTFIGDGFRSK